MNLLLILYQKLLRKYESMKYFINLLQLQIRIGFVISKKQIYIFRRNTWVYWNMYISFFHDITHRLYSLLH